MKKNKILLTILSITMFFTSLTLVACGGNNEGNPYQDFQNSLTTYLADATLFKDGTTAIGSIETNFYFNNFNYKNSEGKIEGDKNYLVLNAYGMNYIQDYSAYLENLEGNYNYSNLQNSLNKLNESFEKIKIESKNIYNADTNANIDIYNGFYANYLDEAKNFINAVYDTAINISNFLIEDVNVLEGFGTDKQTIEQTQFCLDTQVLYVFDDIRKLLLESGEGKQFIGENLYDGAVANLSYFANISTKNVNLLTAEMADELLEKAELLEGERVYLNKALESFSLYEYVEVYESSIESYQKDESNAFAYYTELQKYYSDSNNFLYQYQNFLSLNIYE